MLTERPWCKQRPDFVGGLFRRLLSDLNRNRHRLHPYVDGNHFSYIVHDCTAHFAGRRHRYWQIGLDVYSVQAMWVVLVYSSDVVAVTWKGSDTDCSFTPMTVVFHARLHRSRSAAFVEQTIASSNLEIDYVIMIGTHKANNYVIKSIC